MELRDISVLAHMVGAQYEAAPDRHILTFVDERLRVEETRTYGELYQNAHRLAAYLSAQGMVEGDRFGILLKNHPEVVEGLIAASITGCLAVPIDPRIKGDKLVYMLKDSGCKGLIHGDYNTDAVNAIMGRVSVGWTLIVGDTYGDAMTGGFVLQPIRCKSGADPMQIIYTSGTTGDPKGIIKNNGIFSQVAMALPMLMKINRKRDVLYTGLSLSHGNAQFLTLAVSLGAGIPAVFSRSFSRSRLWDTIRKYGCTTFNLLGGMSAAIYNEPRKDDDADNPIRVVLSAGMPAFIWDDFEKRFDVKIFEAFGAAEGGLFWNDGSGPIGSFGQMENGLFIGRVVDETDQDCGPDQPGELIWKNKDGQPVSVDYLNQPEASAKKVRDGWFRTGDIVHKDENNWLYFDFRKGGGIRRNGDFVNAGFVEKVIAENRMVSDVCVYGVPIKNGTPGEKDVVAAIVPADPASFDPQAIFADCRGKLEANFVPSFIHVVSEIPKTISERPQERFLLGAFSETADYIHKEAR